MECECLEDQIRDSKSGSNSKNTSELGEVEQHASSDDELPALGIVRSSTPELEEEDNEPKFVSASQYTGTMVSHRTLGGGNVSAYRCGFFFIQSVKQAAKVRSRGALIILNSRLTSDVFGRRPR